MAAIPSVVIGLGTTGSIIATRVYEQYMQHCSRYNDNPATVQFLLIDTDDPPQGAGPLQARNDVLPLGVPNGEQLRQAMQDGDPFFRTWWDSDYTNIGSLYPGASAVPMKGRLAFWARLGAPHAPQSFINVYQNKVTMATAAQPAANIASVLVVLLGTLSGGTGAGAFLDVAQIVRQVTRANLELHGIFLMPEVARLRAERYMHDRVTANGYGCLVDLNYWQTPTALRPCDLGAFMEIGGERYEGDTAPLDVAWLVCRSNVAGHALVGWEDYLSMSASAVAAMLFESRAQSIRGGMNNLIASVNATDRTGHQAQPRRYGSLATYSLRYSPERAMRYLSSQVGIESVDALRASAFPQEEPLESPSAGNASEERNTLEARFLRDHSLREADLSGKQGSLHDEVIDALQRLDGAEVVLYPWFRQVVSDLARTDGPTVLRATLTARSITRGRVTQEVEELCARVKASLDGTLTDGDRRGVNFRSLLRSNWNAIWSRAVLGRTATDQGRTTGLYQQVEWLLGSGACGLTKARRFLDDLAPVIEAQANSLHEELKGRPQAGQLGDEDNLANLENDLEDRVQELVREMFAPGVLGRNRQRQEAVKRFEEGWWRRWVRLHMLILAKREAISLYAALGKEIDWLQNLLAQMESRLQTLRASQASAKQGIYMVSSAAHTVRREEEALTNGDRLVAQFRAELSNTRDGLLGSLGHHLAEAVRVLSSLNQEQRADSLNTELDQVQGHILDTVRTSVSRSIGPALEALSLWDALEIDSGLTGSEDIGIHVAQRIQAVRAQCRPFWKLSPAYGVANGLPVENAVMAYNPDALDAFYAKHQGRIAPLPLPEAAVGTAAPDGARQILDGALNPSSQELTYIVFQGGAALHYVEEIEAHLTAFQRVCRDRGQPVLRDHRLLTLTDREGLPVWRIVSTAQQTDRLYFLLMAEHFGYLDTPLLREGVTSGRHRLGQELARFRNDLPLRSSSRERAFADLTEAAIAPDLEKTIQGLMQAKRKQYNEAQWREEHLVAYQRIRRARDRTTSDAVRDCLDDHIGALELVIEREFGLAPDRVEALANESTVAQRVR